MITFRFTATCGEQSLPLEVRLQYRPGRQSQRARRVAVGELLGLLELDKASIEPAGDDQLKVTTAKGTWVIGEARGLAEGRGRF
jgi:hypothetical protein